MAREYKLMERFRHSKLNYGFEEIKFIRSFGDLITFLKKIGLLAERWNNFQTINYPTPPSLQIEPTNFCNARCICCSSSISPRPKGYMDLSLFKKIIDDASRIGVKRIHLYLHGEPLIHPQILEMISYVKAKSLALVITSNGMRLDSRISNAVLKSGIGFEDQFIISMLGSSKNIHEKIMRGVNHEKVIENISNFIELRNKLRKNGPIIETVFYSMSENKIEESEYEKYWRGNVDHVKLGGWISENFMEHNQPQKSTRHRQKTCIQIWERLTIYWNGDVALCCQDINGEWILGNLRDQSISEVWTSEQLHLVKKIHADKRFQDFPFCDQCDM